MAASTIRITESVHTNTLSECLQLADAEDNGASRSRRLAADQVRSEPVLAVELEVQPSGDDDDDRG